MGYRSDVAFAVRKSILDSHLSSLPEENRDLIIDLLKSSDEQKDDYWDNREEEIWLLYEWIDCKWYEEHYAINWINDFVKNNPDDCSFIKIGEKNDDVEIFGFGNDPFLLSYQRRIIHS